MATNRIDILDPALLRPGRIDRKIEFPNPNEDARLDILTIHSRKMNLTRGIELRKIAASMHEASGAETKAVCTEAGMFALRERRVHVTQDDFEMAVAKVMQKDSEKNMVSSRRAFAARGSSIDPEPSLAPRLMLAHVCPPVHAVAQEVVEVATAITREIMRKWTAASAACEANFASFNLLLDHHPRAGTPGSVEVSAGMRHAASCAVRFGWRFSLLVGCRMRSWARR